MTDVLSKILRVHSEPCTYVSESAVHHSLVVAPSEYLAFVSNWLTLLANNRATMDLPAKWICTDIPAPGSGDFRVMPCVVRWGAEVIKTVKIVGTNRRQQLVPDQITVGKAVRLHPEENFITHVFEACLLSSARTGLCAALAVSRLAPVRRKITIVGAGRVGYYAARYTLALGGVEEITFRDVQPDRAAQTASAVGTFCRAEKLTAPIHCDVLILATTAGDAFCHPQTTNAKVIVSLGADSEDQHELAPAWASAADIYFDGPDCLQVGDIRAWRSAGFIAEDNLTSLLDLWRNGPRASNRPRIFISTGCALLDNLTIAYLLEQSSPALSHPHREPEAQGRT
jgi:ornithine cyclodeaminase/alanine dehydrogenase-like protein (mu-crystallin family)